MKRAILGSLVVLLTFGLCTSAEATSFNSTIAIGKATTNEKGKWTIEVPVGDLEPGNKYYAFVRAEDLGNQINCEKAFSDVVTFVGG